MYWQEKREACRKAYRESVDGVCNVGGVLIRDCKDCPLSKMDCD